MLAHPLPHLQDGATEEEAARLAQAKQAAVSRAARLIVFGALPAPQRAWLASQLVSYYVGQETEVTEAVKELCRWVGGGVPKCVRECGVALAAVFGATIFQSRLGVVPPAGHRLPGKRRPGGVQLSVRPRLQFRILENLLVAFGG